MALDTDTMRMIYAVLPVIAIQIFLFLVAKNLVAPKINIVADWAKKHEMATQGKLIRYHEYGDIYNNYNVKNFYCQVKAEYQYAFRDGTSGVIKTVEKRRYGNPPPSIISVYKYKDGKVYAPNAQRTTFREFLFLFVIPIALWAFFYHALP